LPGFRDILKTQREWQFDLLYVWKLIKIRSKKLLKKKKRKGSFIKLKLRQRFSLTKFKLFSQVSSLTLISRNPIQIFSLKKFYFLTFYRWKRKKKINARYKFY
jgi:hypothetical protein